MLNLNSQNFDQAISAVKPTLSSGGKREARANAKKIISAIVKAFGKKARKTVGSRTGRAAVAKGKKKLWQSGLVYGRIQSGKTRAMITSSALAFDNGFRVVVVITSNNNRLVGQTQRDFQDGLPGNIRVYSKAHFKQEVQQAKQILESGSGGIILVCSKGKARLNQAIEFLKRTGARDCKSVIFDDEGDQATLDTNTLARSTRNPNIKPSTIHGLIHDPAVNSLRKALPQHVFVSVTGTPSGIVLQNIDNRSRPSFVEMLEPGKEYVGGDVFFSKLKPQINELITLTDKDERIELLGKDKKGLPEGLKSAIRLFLLAAAAAGEKLGWPENGQDRGYKLLCHPSVRNADQEKVADRIRNYLVELTKALNDPTCALYGKLKASYESLKRQTPDIPPFNSLLAIVRTNIPSREVQILNKNTTAQEINYSKYFNFWIGGNTLGRGLAIKNLLVTYYVREAKVTQMDTMYQHARMFGYREQTLPYTRVFLPPQLYERFREIFISDENLRTFIEQHSGTFETFPVRIARDIKATRSCILDARKVDVLIPGRQIYPNYPYFKTPQSEAIAASVHQRLKNLFPDYKTQGRNGRPISIDEAIKLVSLIRTNGTNIWNDKKMPAVLSYLGQQFKSGVILKYRKTDRKADDSNGLVEVPVRSGSTGGYVKRSSRAVDIRHAIQKCGQAGRLERESFHLSDAGVAETVAARCFQQKLSSSFTAACPRMKLFMKTKVINLINATVVDAFCGIGGLSHGMILEGFKVAAGVDNDESCKYAFETNNGAKFIHKDIAKFSSSELKKIYKGSRVAILTGCAPCQPFSSLNKKKAGREIADERWKPLSEFKRLIIDVRPDIVSMENVPDLSNKQKYPIFKEFTEALANAGYRVSYKTVDVSRYGVPQKRKRLVLLASLLGDISLIAETHAENRLVTVRDAISDLRPLEDGEVDSADPLHRASKLSAMNRKRIRATHKDGGSASRWPKELMPPCYKRKSGRSFMCSVYGRMRWDDPAPTMTTHCVTLGTGRFGHPTQNRAISLREAAIFQSFPKNYIFAVPSRISTTKVAKQIGNAVPVLLGRVIARSIRKHIQIIESGKRLGLLRR